MPHLNFCFFQAFAQHPLCLDINFIEEGIVDFCKDERKPERLSLKSRFINFYFFRNTQYWHSSIWNTYTKLQGRKIKETFAITDKLFQNVPAVHTVVKWPHIKVEESYDEDACFFVFESTVGQKIVDLDLYLEACGKIAEKFGKKHNYAKYHPYQTENERTKIETVFLEKGLKIERLRDDIPFEMILCNLSHIRVCGFTTSLVFYAALMGHEAHICASALSASPQFREYWEKFKQSLSVYGEVFKYEKI